jgi:hypothetical protein
VHIGNSFNDALAGKSSTRFIHGAEDGAGIDDFIVVKAVIQFFEVFHERSFDKKC